MGIINLLEESVANLIAAGEVVERPASVIKELVENSIDAGAKNITVEIRNGGMTYMRVTDDGCGIASDDVGFAFLRHATSKIKTKEDLAKIGTLGFRGEALCSIAAVSNVSLISKTRDASFATKVIFEGGSMEDVLSVGGADGTTIEVKKLFYNTPARMKFLKKDSTEAGYVADVVEKFILANPGVSFRYINNGKQERYSPGNGDGIDAIYSVYGKDYAKSVIRVEYENENMSVSGYIGKSNISRPNRAYQSFFVNGRSIKSAVMTRALEEAYKNQIMIGKFPFAVLDLKVDFTAVDVNVHPHKTEVKFSDDRQVYETVYWGVKNALYEKPIIPEGEFNTKKPFVFNDAPKQEFKTIAIEEEAKKEKPAFIPAKPQEKVSTAEIKLFNEKVLEPMAKAREEIYEKKDLNKTFAPVSLKETPAVVYNAKEEQKPIKEQEPQKAEAVAEIKEEIKKEIPEYKICGCVFNTYVIVEQEGKMLMIDQHAAHERIKFEQIIKSISEGKVASQQLICPVVVNLSNEEYEFATSNKELFLKLGFEIEELGFKQIMINALPLALCDMKADDLFVEILGDAMENKKNLISADYERSIYTVACKAAVKANMALSGPEMEALVRQVFEMDNINTCPHGRPIIVSFTKTEIEKQFKRIV